MLCIIFQPVVSAGGFTTIPRLSHETVTITPTIPGPTTLNRTKSIQKQGSTSTSTPPKQQIWATFDSLSPSRPASDTQFEDQFSPPTPTPPWIRSKLESKFMAQTRNQSQRQTKSLSKTQSEPVREDKSQTVPSKTFEDKITKEEPFKQDPFFSSTPATVASAMAVPDTVPMYDRYAVFSNMSQISSAIQTATNQTATETNPFNESVFVQLDSVESPPFSNSSLNRAFASTPIQYVDKDTVSSDAFKFKAFMDSSGNKKDVLQSTSSVFMPPTSKPNVLDIDDGQKKTPAAHTDPFGAVTPTTEAKLNTSMGVSNDDPFDTSLFMLPKSLGPLDLSQLKPVSLNQSRCRNSNQLSMVIDDHEGSFKVNLPSPNAPPPLPTITPPPFPIMVPSGDLAPPVPPPRAQSGTVAVQSMATPPPIPKRLPLVTNQSPQLLRQTTIQFPMDAVAPPPPPPRPGINSIEPTKLDTSVHMGSLSEAVVQSDYSFSLPPLRPDNSEPLQVQKSRTFSAQTSISQISRPRPRAKTPANTSSGFTVPDNLGLNDMERPASASEFTDAFSVHKSSFVKAHDKFEITIPAFDNPIEIKPLTSSGTRDSPLICSMSNLEADPFAEVDPFADEEKSDPFSDMHDPFTMESPMDPFSKDFKGELFTTKAVTLSSSEAPDKSSDPFVKDAFDTNIDRRQQECCNDVSKESYEDSTCTGKTDTSLEASVSLPFGYSTDLSSAFNSDDSSMTQQADSTTPNNQCQSNKWDPFECGVFSNDFFKNQFKGGNLECGKSNMSWIFPGDRTDFGFPKPADNVYACLPDSSEHVSPGLTLSSIPVSTNQDADSSSNSEISDAFGEDIVPHQVSKAGHCSH